MKLFLVLIGTLCLFKGSVSQGFLSPFNDLVDFLYVGKVLEHKQPNHFNPHRRQFSVGQSPPFISTGQQSHGNQHRFNIPQGKQSQYVIQQSPSVEIPLNSIQQKTNQRQHSAGVRFPDNSNQFRGANPPQQQHHTQTSFIPNFSPQSTIQTIQSQQQQQPHNVQHQRSIQNQLRVPQSPFDPQQSQQQPQQPLLQKQTLGTIREQYIQQVGPQQALPERVLNSHFNPQNLLAPASNLQQKHQQQQQHHALQVQQGVFPQGQSPPTLQPPPQFQNNAQQIQPPKSQQLPIIEPSTQQYFTQTQQTFQQKPVFPTAPHLTSAQQFGNGQFVPSSQPQLQFSNIPQLEIQQTLPQVQNVQQFRTPLPQQLVPQQPIPHQQFASQQQQILHGQIPNQQFTHQQLHTIQQELQQQQFQQQQLPNFLSVAQFQQPTATQFQSSPQLSVNPNFQNHQQLQPQNSNPIQQQPKQEKVLVQQNGNILFSGSETPGNSQFQTIISPIQKTTVDQELKLKLKKEHEQFVQKQFEKQQNKVKQLHDEFIQKQQQIKGTSTIKESFFDLTTPTSRGRPIIHPSESELFNLAVKKYNEEHPTTPTTTTTSEKIKTSDQDPYEILLQAQRKDIYSQLKLETDKSKLSKTKAGKPLGRDELLKQLKAALAESSQSQPANKTYEETDLVLPNGQRVQVIRTNNPNLIPKDQLQSVITQQELNEQNLKQKQQAQQKLVTTSKKSQYNFPADLHKVAPKVSQDLVLPDGKKVEIIRQSSPSSGGFDLSQLANLYGGAAVGSDDTNSLASSAVITSDSDEPPSLEELAKRGLIPEGYEIQGLSSSSSKPKPTQPPPTKKKATYVYLEEQPDGSFKIQGVKANGEKDTKTTGSEVESILERIKSGEIKLPPTVKRLHLPSEDEVLEQSTISSTTTTTTTTTTASPPLPTSTYTPRVTFPSSTASPYSTVVPLINRSSQGHTATYRSTTLPSRTTHNEIYTSSTHKPVTEKLTATTEKQFEQQTSNPGEDLVQILRQNGLYAMSKYLKQSGLDSILNETGPYTVFVPTDKAFKNLLIQLGGPERAEEKFKSNPRLLSGLLLHHVIPGAFEVSSLQDEMTGVSLAGTQLRVNQYTMHDQEWNDVLITTINGAMIVNEKKDIKIPQGIAHGVDRVMFPLPVGDLLQTLQSDRENRFTNFLKILYTSGMSEILQNKGTKTYTVFAPTDKAFNELETEDLQKLLTEKDLAESFAMKHIMPTTLFSAGMRFYQVKDSLLEGKTITLQKTNAGRIKVNEASMIAQNIPATNGVIHVLDGIL
ncbi:uncharacterized protein LOC129612366 [Condylostylus longicornis]|uniref:uncharacterized protein LOC129612366 n=1 Tax=Condylostylus longicornis TaxID=2530218 RepID=UPI00244DA6C1|nr:uncharacterized protein LOC129612366 [Condylostylus longicornis]